MIHPTHRTRFSFSSSSYDEICELCGAADGMMTFGQLAYECPASDEKRNKYDELKKEKDNVIGKT